MVMTEHRESVQVVYALPGEQRIVDVSFRRGMTVSEAVEASGLEALFPEIGAHALVVGVFGTRVSLDRVVEPGDRVEICRPLIADPRAMRRELWSDGKVMGGKPIDVR
jgi:putative ubiquitin-RnfH superfamily antitoxin RatB of RatAB toxin-antitoxin module